ncbi:MAG TPA: CCA tRNA nucleotidyltransferase, partial [Candidatus Polarisedimenticolaceae bacterium]|nr:CCA tRNA nucleotidyltransferase [Candidatus Polarisedimenticolaceae bacterium]
MLKRIRDLLIGKNRTSAGNPPSTGTVEALAEPPPEPAVRRGPEVVHRPIAREELDPDAVKIIQRLTRFDHGAYLVGGCVRDLLLDRKPKDFDIGTSATPRQIKRLFRNSRIIGRRFRLAHIYFQNGKIIEVATFRAQDDGDAVGDGGNGRGDLLIRDDNQFGTMEQDALRRDFTINSLFYDVNAETVLDHSDGLGDLRRRTIRTIGDPDVRFKEDPIRILRAIKFAARLDFDIERETRRALYATRDEIPKAAAPRILEEINRFCRGGAARRSFELMRENGVFEIVLPELAAAYGDDERVWKLLYRFLERFDARIGGGGGEVQTGQILAALLLPALMSDLGFHFDGSVARPESSDLGAAIDRYRRPLAARLRASRRDQEQCRQLLLTLERLVPRDRLHRNTKRALSRRLALADAMDLLHGLGAVLGGEFSASARAWEGEAGGRDRRSHGDSRGTPAVPSDPAPPARGT